MQVGFVGRVRELEVLAGCLRDAASSVPHCVLVEGGGGSGKTALVRAFAAEHPGIRLAWATGDEAEAGLPYGVLDELSHQLNPVVDDPRRAADQRDPFVEGAALLQTLGGAQRSGPVLLVLDDAHLADNQSLAAVTFALRRLRTDQVLAVLAVREERAARLPPGLLTLVTDRGVLITLGGLSTAEVVALGVAVGFGRMSERAAARLCEHTEGSPLHLQALMVELRPEQVEALDVPLPVPRSLSSLVLATLGETSPSAQRLAAAAAVLGTGASPSDIAAVARISDPLAGLEELQRSALVMIDDQLDGRRVRFAHPLLRSAVYDDLGVATRATLHTRAAAVRTGAEALRHHATAASGPEPDLVAALQKQAQEDRASGAWHAAAEALFAAVRLRELGPARDRLLVEAVEMLLADGDVPTALRYAATVAALPEDPHTLRVSARLAFLSGQPDAAEEMARAAWEQAREHDPEARDGAAVMLAQLCLIRNDGTGAALWAGRALAAGLLPDDAAAATRATHAFGLALAGRSQDGLRLLPPTSVPAELPGASHRIEFDIRGMLRLWTDDLAGARDDLGASTPSTAFRQGQGLGIFRVAALGYLAETEYRLGNWDTAATVAEQVLSLVDDTGQTFLLAFAHAVAMLVPAARGQWSVAEQHLGAAQRAAAASGDAPSHCFADNAAVHLAACRGDADAVVRSAQWLLTDGPGGTHEPGFYSWPVNYVAALVTLRRFDEASTELARLELLAHQRQRRSRQAALARVRGELAAAQRDTASARGAFRQAVRLGDGAVDALEAAIARAAYGRFLRRRGERRAAIEQLGDARQIFASLRAEPFLRRVESELKACGSRVRANAQPAQTSLTHQELAVARLVCAGLTNRGVADELVLSVKTVEYHLGHVYTKLGIRSRTELVNQLRMTNLASET